jgi:hypothetical protein
LSSPCRPLDDDVEQTTIHILWLQRLRPLRLMLDLPIHCRAASLSAGRRASPVHLLMRRLAASKAASLPALIKPAGLDAQGRLSLE